MRVTLIYPSVGRKENTPYVRAWQMQPLSMALIASLTPPDVEVRFYDDRIEDIPFEEPTDLVALSVETFTALRAYKIARRFRACGVPVVMGGYHVTLLPDEASRESDAIVVGDAEPVWAQVLDDARRGCLQPVYDGRGRRTVGGLRPRRELIPLGINWVGQASIHIAQDDELLGLMVKSGCRGVLIGMESLDPANLRDMGKSWNLASGSYAESLRRFRDHGLAVYGTFVFGYDNDDNRVIQRSVEFAREQQLFLAAFNHLIPFPGTPLYRRLQQEGRLLKPRWWLDPTSRVGEVTFRPKKLEPAELEELCLNARRQFYGWGSIWQRLWDRRANAPSLPMLSVYLALNLGSHFDIDRRQGLRLGAGLAEWKDVDEPVSV
jgi:radical SAM superfamily enzyme YgiQ (UPF0313 family)